MSQFPFDLLGFLPEKKKKKEVTGLIFQKKKNYLGAKFQGSARNHVQFLKLSSKFLVCLVGCFFFF